MRAHSLATLDKFIKHVIGIKTFLLRVPDGSIGVQVEDIFAPNSDAIGQPAAAIPNELWVKSKMHSTCIVYSRQKLQLAIFS